MEKKEIILPYNEEKAKECELRKYEENHTYYTYLSIVILGHFWILVQDLSHREQPLMTKRQP